MTIAVQIGCEISCQNNNGIPVVPCPVYICQVVTVIQLELSRERCNLTKIKSKPKIKSQDPEGTLTKAKDHQIFHCISHLVHFLWWVNFWAEFYCTVSLLNLKSLIKKIVVPFMSLEENLETYFKSCNKTAKTSRNLKNLHVCLTF